MFAFTIAGLTGLTLLTGNILGITLTLFGFAVFHFYLGGNYSAVGNAVWNLLNSYAFTAVPSFILLGELLGKTGVARKIYTSLSPLVARLPGKLLQTNIVTCTVFSAVNGSSSATVAVVGAIAFDELERQGYDRRAVIGSIAGAGTLGILIPPSVVLIIYGSWQDVSVGHLFVAGIIPGLMISAFFMTYVAIAATLNRRMVPAEGAAVPLGKALLMSLHAWPFLVLILVILGSVATGAATPTESAALGVVAAIALAACYRELTIKSLWSAVVSTVTIFSSLALILIGATVLSQALALSGMPKYLALAVVESQLSPVLVICLVYLMYFVLGCFFAGVDMMLITLPFVFPLVTALGYDPVWLGIALVILIEIAILTPPVGVNLFVIMAVTRGRVSLAEAARAAFPYWLLLLFALGLITVWPGIVTFLPRLAF